MIYYICVLLLFLSSVDCNLNGITDYNFVNTRRLTPLSCPCEDTSLCQPIPRAKSEVKLAYSTTASNWKYYDYSKLTEIAIFFDVAELEPQMICTAHKNNVQLHLKGFFKHETFLNSTQRAMWIKDTLDLVKENFLDGINIDYEEGRSSAWEPHLVKFVEELASTLKNMNPNYQLTYCLPTWPLDNYDFDTIPKIVDYLMLMDYDQNWNNPTHCYASANQQAQVTLNGLFAFLELGIPPSKIVIGLPWYGYLYPCVNVTNGKCHFDNCSRNEGKQVNPTNIYDRFLTNKTYTFEQGWDNATITPFLTIIHNGSDSQSTKQQYWYDSGYSLTQKASIYKYYDILGIAAFHVDCVNYTIPDMKEFVIGLWDSFNVFED